MDSTSAHANGMDFEQFFKSTEQARDAFLSRLFGLFNEDVVRNWCRCPQAPYEDLGRPTLWKKGSPTLHPTLDFTLRERALGGRTFVAEMKCELQYEGYKYLRLTDAGQLTHHAKAPGIAFKWFLESALAPGAFDVRVAGKPVLVDGTILIWGAVAPEGSAAVNDAYGISAILSVEAMIRDLRRWQPAHWVARVRQLRLWANQLFDVLAE